MSFLLQRSSSHHLDAKRSAEIQPTAVAIVRQHVRVCVCAFPYNALIASKSVPQSVLQRPQFLTDLYQIWNRLPDKWRITHIPFTAKIDFCSAHARRPTSGVTTVAEFGDKLSPFRRLQSPKSATIVSSVEWTELILTSKYFVVSITSPQQIGNKQL